MSNSTGNARYRPSFTAADITTMMTLALAAPQEPAVSSIIAKLAPINAKIALGVDKPSYTNTPPPSLLDRLEGDSNGNEVQNTAQLLDTLQEKVDAVTVQSGIVPSSYATKEQYWEACYKYSLITDNILTTEMLSAVAEHKYLEGLMSPEEEAAFEKEGEL